MSISQLAAKIVAIPTNECGRRRYPDALKREIMASLAASGLGREAFAERIGISSNNLWNWKELAPKGSTRRAADGFKMVEVESDPAASGQISLRAPGGVIVEGLSVAAAAALIAAIGRGSSC